MCNRASDYAENVSPSPAENDDGSLVDEVLFAAAESGWFGLEQLDESFTPEQQHAVAKALADFAAEWRKPTWPEVPQRLWNAWLNFIIVDVDAAAVHRSEWARVTR